MMKSLSCIGRSWAVVVALMAAAWSTAGVASADQADTQRQRLEANAGGDRETEAKVKLKKTITNDAAWVSFGPLPASCDPGFSFNVNQGLVTKESNFSGSATVPNRSGTWQYDRHGNPIVVERTFGQNWVRTECGWDDEGDLHKGKLVYMRETDNRFGPGPVYRASYNARDQHEVETEEFDFPYDGIVDRVHYTRYFYDEGGLLVKQVREFDYDVDGTIDDRIAWIGTYDSNHRLERVVFGYYDSPDGAFIPYETNWSTIDTATGYTTRTLEYDDNGDGISEAIYAWRGYVNSDGRILSGAYESDRDGPDGVADGIVDTRTEEWHEYDAAGNRLRLVYDAVLVDFWNIQYREEHSWTYDNHGRISQFVRFIDDYRDGTVNEFTTWDYTRDERGDILEWLDVREALGFKSYTRHEYKYDGTGNRLEDIESRWLQTTAPKVIQRTVWEYTAGRSGQTGSGNN
jgi:hypothetical protein